MDDATAVATFTPAATEAMQAFPVDPGELTLVSLTENATFRVVDASTGDAFVLRLHRPGYHTLDELVSERMWLGALADAGVAVPVAVPAIDGRAYVEVVVAATGETRLVGLSRWSDGEIVADVLGGERPDALAAAYERLGTIMAAMHTQASGWRPPPTFRRHAFDADGLMGARPFWGPFWEHPVLTSGQRRLLIATRDALHAALERLGRHPATFSMIHGDLHLRNLLIGPDGLTVIDFDDAGFGWHQYDIAVALYYTARLREPATVESAFLRGYRSLRPLDEEAWALIPMFRLIRGMALIGWKHDRPEVTWPAGEFERIKDDVLEACDGFEPPC